MTSPAPVLIRPLLFSQEIASKTPEGHQDCEELVKALQLVSETAQFCEEKKEFVTSPQLFFLFLLLFPAACVCTEILTGSVGWMMLLQRFCEYPKGAAYSPTCEDQGSPYTLLLILQPHLVWCCWGAMKGRWKYACRMLPRRGDWSRRTP